MHIILQQLRMFSFIDYRNAVYNGQTQDGKPHGLGIIIDNQLLFLLAEFKHGEIEGAFFAVYADCKVFCGHLKNKELKGLCCFFLKDRMQVFMNYSPKAKQDSNLIAVLPFCKVILEVDNSQQQHPKVTRYENYGGKAPDLKSILEDLFGSYYGLDEFSSWQSFLIINFIQPYHKKLYWKTVSCQKYTEFFVGVKSSGLGIKMLVFQDDQHANNVQGSPLLVSSIGNFQNGENLKGYGQRLIDYQLFAKVQEGIFFENEKETFEYLRKSRPGQIKNFFQKHLLKSVNFQNIFFNLGYFYQLEKFYAKLNVSLVEETHKIALVTINRPNSTIELAEIEKRQRKKNQTPPKTRYSPIKTTSYKPNLKETAKEQSFQENSDKSMIYQQKYTQPQNNSGTMSEAKKSIFGSVQKVKKINPEVRLNAKKKFEKMLQGENNRDASDSLERKSRNESKNKVSLKQKLYPTESNNFDRFINSSIRQQPRLVQRQDRNRFKYAKMSQFDLMVGREHRHQKEASFTPTKYEKMLENIDDPNPNFKYSGVESSYQRTPPKTYQSFQPFKRRITPEKQSLVQRLQRSPYSRQNQPYYKTVLEEDVYSKYEHRIHQKQNKLKYFNNLFGSNSNISLEQNGRNERALSPALKNKTPGKIKIINRKKDNQFLY